MNYNASQNNKTCYLTDTKTISSSNYESNSSCDCENSTDSSNHMTGSIDESSCNNSSYNNSSEYHYKIKSKKPKKRINECDKIYSRSERMGTVVDMLHYLSRPLSGDIEKLSYIPLPEFQIRNSSILNIIENNYSFKLRNEIDLLNGDILQIKIELPKLIYNFFLGDEILESGLIKISLAIENHIGYKWCECSVITEKQGCGAFLLTATFTLDEDLDCVEGFRYNIGFTKPIRVYKRWCDKKENNMIFKLSEYHLI